MQHEFTVKTSKKQEIVDITGDIRNTRNFPLACNLRSKFMAYLSRTSA